MKYWDVELIAHGKAGRFNAESAEEAIAQVAGQMGIEDCTDVTYTFEAHEVEGEK